jgi:hypothetical protein
VAEVALRQAGWRLASLEDGGGWRCSQHVTSVAPYAKVVYYT